MSSGIIIIDKPADWTSHDVIAKCRGIFRQRRIGHAGTLDPMATGVLPVFVGRATRAVEFAIDGEKTYLARCRFGQISDTQDSTGRILEERIVDITQADLEAALPRFLGAQTQLPPMYSAIKINGKKLYDLARKGKEVERTPRPITIHRLELTAFDGCTATLLVQCSKGTYIRTLCHDLGQYLGCGALMSGLRRTAACGYGEAQAVTLEQLQGCPDPSQLLMPVDSLFQMYPSIDITLEQTQKCRNGLAFPCAAPDGTYRVYGPDGEFLMLGHCKAKIMSTIKSFYEVISP
jgi:tRNA pseudouridine 55 synthase